MSRPATSVDCPVCGYVTLSARGVGERCRVCGWRDDVRPEADEALHGPRINFIRYRAADPAERFGVDPPAADLPRLRWWTLDLAGRLHEHRASSGRSKR